MSMSVSRVVLRRSTKLPSRSVARRFESTTSEKAAERAKEAAEKATEKAKELQIKAMEGLSRVSSAAGPAISGAAKRLGDAVGKIGGRTGRFIGFVERQIPPTVYYARVGLELGKLVFQGQKMAPPPVTTFEGYFRYALKILRQPATLLQETQAIAASPQSLLQRIRSLNTSQLAYGAVVGAECLGFFTVGEMVGRMKIVGYRGDTGAHH